MIPVKEKPCKGTGVAVGYGCGKKTLYREHGLGKMCCYADWLLNSEAGKIKLAKVTLKITQPRIDLQNAFNEKHHRTRLSNLLLNTKIAVHAYVRERDKGKACISCNGLWQSDFQAGHFFKAELYSTLRFDEKNISGQCVGCNIRKDGNESGYRVGIINRYGKSHLDYLDDLAQKENQQTHKWDRHELENIRTLYKQKLKEIK
ncbi:MAG: recombination protein NinG [Flavobacterium sp.]|nr:recombination protein NinG [Flavobacterium sp.]